MTNKWAASVCGFKPQAQVVKPDDLPNKQSTVPAGLYEYQYTDGDGLLLDCHLEYEAHEAATQDCPGTPESITLIYALCNGVDIANVLSEDVIAQIEEEALCSMEMDKWGSDYDKGEERYNDKELA